MQYQVYTVRVFGHNYLCFFVVVGYVAVTMQALIHQASLMTKELPSLLFILKSIVSNCILVQLRGHAPLRTCFLVHVQLRTFQEKETAKYLM